jgi:outer membrane immunogenic protein
MKKWHAGLLGLALTSTFALSANATDMYRGSLKDAPPPPVYVAAPLWNGFYIGVNGGYGEDANNGPLSPSGGFGGGQIGFNWQGLFGASPWVLGIEADLQGSGISDSYSEPGLSVESSLNWFGTVRGRLGYAVGPTLIYATGGFAYGDVELKATDGVTTASISKTQTGYVVGGGVEYKFNPAWSVKAEYQYINLDASDWGTVPLNLNPYTDRSEVNTFRVGLNYAVGHGGFGPLN